MITIFLPITTRKTTLAEIVKNLKNLLYKDIKLHLACEKNSHIVSEFEKIKTNDKLKISLDIFSVGTQEESMINYVIKSIEDTNFILVRNNTKNFTTENLNKIITESLLGYDVIMLEKEKKNGKIKSFFINIANKLCKSFFNFTYYNGDIGVQYFNSVAHAILKTTNATLLTKLNRWLALNIHYVPASATTTEITSAPPKKSIIGASVFSALFILTIVFGILLPLWSTISLIIIMLIISALIIEIAIGMYYFIEIYNYKKVGVLSCDKIDSIERWDV